MKKYSNTLLILLFIFLLACSSSDESQGVVSTNDLSSDTTVTTIAEEVVQEVVSVEDAQLLLARLDTELEFAQCFREKGIEVEDPNAERPLRSILISLVQSGQYLEDQIRQTAGECFDELGLEPPQQGGG